MIYALSALALLLIGFFIGWLVGDSTAPRPAPLVLCVRCRNEEADVHYCPACAELPRWAANGRRAGGLSRN